MKNFYNYLTVLNDIYGNENSLVIGGGIELPQNLINIFNTVYVIEADNQRKEKIFSILDSSNIKFINELVYKDEKVKFYNMNNSLANSIGELDENLKRFFPNLFINHIEEKSAISIEKLLEEYNIKTKMIIINTLNSINILKNNDFDNFEVIACKILNDELSDVIDFFKRNNFKLLKTFEKINPNIIWTVFVKDFQKLVLLKEKVLSECTQKCNKKDKENQQLMLEINEYKNIMKKLNNEKNKLNLIIQDKNNKIKSLEEKIKNLEKEIDITNNNLQIKIKEYELAQQELEKSKKILSEKDIEVDLLIKKVEELNKEIFIFKSENQQLNEFQKEKENLIKTFEEINKKLEDNEKLYKDKLDKLSKELQNKEENNKQLNIKIKKYENEISNLKETLKRNEDKINELKKQLNEKTYNYDKINRLYNILLKKELVDIKWNELEFLDENEKIDFITSFALTQDDPLETIDKFILDEKLDDKIKFELCYFFGLKIAKKDRYQGISYLNNARYFLYDNKLMYKKLIEAFAKLNASELAVDLEMEMIYKFEEYEESIRKKLIKSYQYIREESFKEHQHGHQLLIDYIEKNIPDGNSEKKILLEIGTTRENIPGQGSTLQLAKLCKRKNIKFITVDMDPHNTRWANFISKKFNLGFTAVNKKGEDYLRDDIDFFDFVFLDAYDFDHGRHSEIRQQRYIKNLGSNIDDKECHIMHLECAKSIVNKLAKDGVVCIDDTWQDEDGKWCAKGTLAVPYLLENGFKVINMKKNRAILLKRKNL
jgi:flagellar biosynthesis GTPase FlhF